MPPRACTRTTRTRRGARARRRQHPRRVVQDPGRGRASPTDARGRDLRARLALRRPRAVHQGPPAHVRLQLPRHPARAAVSCRAARRPASTSSAWSSRRRGWASTTSRSAGATLYVDDKVVAEEQIRTQTGHFSLCGEGLCIGYDGGDAVSSEYRLSSLSRAAHRAGGVPRRRRRLHRRRKAFRCGDVT